MPAMLEPIPARWYFEGEPFQHEKQTVFATEWQMLARTGLLVQAGDFVTGNLGGWPVFAMVGEDGLIRAFHNVCRHRGMQVLEKPDGRCEALRCRYHGWTYDFSGRMISAPAIVAPHDPDSADNHLYRIASTDWRGLLFININREALPLQQDMSGLPDAGERFPLGSQWFHSEFTTELNCNWKTYIEHCLASRRFVGADGGDWLWQWPTLMIQLGPSSVCVQQLVARSFGRSRVIEHLFFSAAHDPSESAGAVEEAKRRAQANKASAELLQARREAGEPAATDESRFAAFHERLRTAHARVAVNDTLPLQGTNE